MDDKNLPLGEKPDEKPIAIPTSLYDTWRDMAAIIVANLASFLLGVLAQQLFPVLFYPAENL